MEKMPLKYATNRDNYMEAYKDNVLLAMSEKGYTVRKLAEVSDVPLSTLNSFLYGKPTDCKLSTTVKLARALDVSIDELVGCGTIKLEERVALSQSRGLPDRLRYLIRWFINFQANKTKNNKNTEILDVMIPSVRPGSQLFPTQNFEQINISYLPHEIRTKIFMGIRIVTENYMPFYTPYDSILIANDRDSKPYEHCVFIKDGEFGIGRRVIEDGKVKIYSIRDDKFRFFENEADEIIGYIAGVHYNDCLK